MRQGSSIFELLEEIKISSTTRQGLPESYSQDDNRKQIEVLDVLLYLILTPSKEG